ncbi:MAG: hypothetical protein ABI321_15035 [Polyangia bacterium]
MSGRCARLLAVAALVCVGGCYDFSFLDNLPDDLGTDGGSEPSPSLCINSPLVGLIACTGFESELDSFPHSSTNGSTMLDKTHAYRGASSMHVHVDPVGSESSRAEAYDASLPPLVDNSFTAYRAFVYAKDYPPGPSGARLLSVQQSDAPFLWIQIDVNSAGEILLSHKPSSSANAYVLESQQALPRNDWVCLELRVKWGGASTGSIAVLMNDKPLTLLNDMGLTLTAPPPDVAFFGVYYPDAPTASYDLWIDELMIASVPIGCDK